MNVHGLLARSARRFPHRPGIVFGARAWTFAELESRSERVASMLGKLGAGKGDRVAILARNRLEWVEAFFATSKLGCVLVPLSFHLRAEAVVELLGRAAARALLFDREALPAVAAVRGAADAPPILVQMGTEAESWAISYDAAAAGAPPLPVAPAVGGGDLHSICFTSGTTGLPKGALLTHANVVEGNHRTSERVFGYSSGDVFLNPAPLCYRAGWARLVQSVGAGATHVLMERFDPVETLRLTGAHGATVLGVVPTMIRAIDRSPARSGFRSSTIRILIVTGQACPPELRRRILELFPPEVLLYTVFASTEAGIVAVVGPEEQRRPGAGGRPPPGVEVRILDEDGAVLPRGSVGEIAVRTGPPGSSGVMLGYLDDGYARGPAFADGWFRTGDVGRMDADGALHVTDRKRDVVVSGGINIPCVEVEEVIRELPSVQDVAVVGLPDPYWGEVVSAAVVRRPGADVSPDEIVAHCRRRLDPVRKPRIVRFVDQLPVTAAGKVRKDRLREELGRPAPEGSQ